MTVGVGSLLPAVAGPTQYGWLDLASFRGKRKVVLWVYPKDATPG